MFTLCWINNLTEGWDILKTEKELERRVKELEKEGCSLEDMMIFKTENCIVPE